MTTIASPPQAGAIAQRARKVLTGNFGRSLVLIVILLGLWQVLTETGAISGRWLSSPSLVGRRLADLWQSGTLVGAVVQTALELVIGLGLGTIAGIAFGMLFGMVRSLGHVFRPYIIIAYAFPQIVLANLYIIWFGIYATPKVVLAAAVSFFVIFFNVFEGVRNVSPDLVNTLRLMGAKPWTICRTVVWPASLLHVSAGLRSAVSLALHAVIFGEFLISAKGIGNLIRTSGNNLDTTGIMAGVVLLAALAGVINLVIGLQERYAHRWESS